MPQIDQIMTTFGSQLFWLVVTFGIIYLVIGRSMLPKIQSTVDMRRKQISDDLEAAKGAHRRADEIEEDYRARQAQARDTALALMAEAKAKAARETETVLKSADAEIGATLQAAEAEISARTKEALTEIEAVVADATQDMVTKLTGAKVTKVRVNKAVRGALADA